MTRKTYRGNLLWQLCLTLLAPQVPQVIMVCVFVPFMLLFMGQKWRWDYLCAFLCMVGAVYFVNCRRM